MDIDDLIFQSEEVVISEKQYLLLLFNAGGEV